MVTISSEAKLIEQMERISGRMLLTSTQFFTYVHDFNKAFSEYQVENSEQIILTNLLEPIWLSTQMFTQNGKTNKSKKFLYILL